VEDEGVLAEVRERERGEAHAGEAAEL